MDCIDLFKRAAMALQTDPRYLAMDQARKMNDKDEELQNLIGEFNLARMDLNNEIGKTERSDARIAELNEKVNDLYGKIMADEGMVAYNEAKRDCENLVNYIDAIINTAPPAAAATKGIPIQGLQNAAVQCRAAFCLQKTVLDAKPTPTRQQGEEGERSWQSFRP